MDDILKFIVNTVKEAGAKGIVIGLSGGIDSAVVGELAVRALGKDNVTAFLLPTIHTPNEDYNDAKSLIEKWGIKYSDVDIDSMLEHNLGVVVYDEDDDKIPIGNFTARMRMAILYFYANKHNLLVIGTTDRTEDFIGYYTKYGDGGVDLEPIIHLTKTEVRELGKQLGLPERIVNKKSSPRLWADHEAEKELGISYDTIDKILMLHDKTEHKRRMPKCLK